MPTYYINADTGDDGTGDGSSGNPWLTLADAYDNSTTSDTIILQTSTSSFAWVTDTIADRTVQAADSATPQTMDGSGATIQLTLNGTVTFQDIIFTDATHTSGNNTPLFRTNSTGTYTFTRCQFTSSVILTGDSSYGLFVGPDFSTPTATLTINFTSCLFNSIQSTGTNGQMFSRRADAANVVDIDFTFNNCVFAVISATNPIEILFNSASGNGTMDVTMNNTIIYNATGGTLTYASSSPDTSTLSNCDFYLLTGAPSGTDIITTDPLFADEGNGNFNLRPTSPAIGTGIAV